MSKFFNIDIGAAFKSIFGSKEDAKDKSAPAICNDKQQEAEVETPTTLTIWTIERNRYEPARALCTDISVYPSTATTLCEDITCYAVGTPNGETVVIEARTGGLVGHSIEVVMDGIREMTRAQLNNQLDTAKKEFNRMKKIEMSNDDFWMSIKMGGEEIDATQISPEYQE